MEEAIVLYPSPAIGHLISMVELGKLVLTHKPSLSVNILVTTPPYKAGSVTSCIDHVSATIPSIAFHYLPAVSLVSKSVSSPHHETLMFNVLANNNHNVHQSLVSISKTHTVKALVFDFFCTPALSVAEELNIPAFSFYTSGAGRLAAFLYLPTIHNSTNKSFRDLDHDLEIPGVPPIQGTDMSKPLQDRDDKAYEYFIDYSSQMPKANGVIVNSFEVLEPRAIEALCAGLCVPNRPTPPIFCIGPLIAADDGRGETEVECLTWLDSQPSQSVVFLCFGSLGLFSSQQLKEIASGLEKSRQRFLWVVRNPPSEDQNQNISDSDSSAKPDVNLDSLLPDGFLDRVEGRGLVVKQWAPQVAVLNHDSIGVFVTHCGWNSVLEAICSGVPMIAWPLYAEQRFNRVILVKELKLALPMEESEDGFVTAMEVEKRVRELMDSEEGNVIKKQTMAMKEAAKIALSEDGSSRVATRKLIESWN